MAMNQYQKAIRKLVGIRPPDPLGTGVKPAANTAGAATGESVKPSSGATGGAASGASPSILPGVPGQGTVTKPIGVPGQAQVTNLPQNNTIYKKAMDEVTNGQYTSFYKPPEGFGAMGAEDQATWSGIGQKYAAGDQSWLTDTNGFRTNGNWGSYTDENGNINGWLQVLDGTGGFAPVFSGRVGETGYDPGAVFAGPDGTAYIAGADGILKPAGTVNYATYGKAPGPGDGSLHGPFHASDGKTYNYDELTPEQAAMFGLVNSPGGGAHIGSVPEMTDQALAQGATTPEIAALVREDARMEEQGIPVPGTTVRAGVRGGSGTGQTPGRSGIPGRNAQTAPEKTPYQALLERYGYGKAPEWEGSEYQQERDAALRRARDMEWNYDPNTDPVWQAYQKQYRREGQRAIQDTLGRYSQLTGGLPSSYATSAAAQAGNYYAAQLSDRLPQLYQDAYQRYLQEFQRQMGISDQYAGFDQTEYNRFADTRNQWNTDRNFQYGLNRDAVEDARYADETAYSRNYRAQRDAIEDARYDQEWAQKMRAYADEQNWKAKDWAQYLREYEDKMSQQEREWAYQQYRDAVGDERYNQAYADEQAQNAYQRELADREWDYQLSRDALEDERYDAKWAQALREYDDEMAQQAWNNEYKLSSKSSGGSSGGSGGGSKTTGGDDLSPGQYKQGGIVYRSDKTHPQGQPMSAMYEQAYNDTWDKWQRGMDYALLIAEVREMAINKTITDYEGQMILNELRKWKDQGRTIDASKGGGMGSPRTQMTK